MNKQATSCCGPCSCTADESKSNIGTLVDKFKLTRIGKIPLVKTHLNWRERLGTWAARWGVGRMSFRLPPGLYGIGNPIADSPVLVTANYKMTFDHLRRELAGHDAWILVLDTKGINVWCAAGKGTFGTDELVNRIQITRLDQLVTHRQLILPQLGAPGVAAHKVKEKSGFKVIYGPIYAQDIPAFLKNKMTATPAMRKVHFSLRHRLALIPMELVPSLKLIPVFILWVAVNHIVQRHAILNGFFNDLLPFVFAVLTGTVFFQILLPWIPVRSFIAGGWSLGVMTAVAISYFNDLQTPALIVNLLLMPPITAFLAFNFTGATTFTSLSGVKKETTWGIPFIVVSLVTGIIVQITQWF
jgi:hypothetical protein